MRSEFRGSLRVVVFFFSLIAPFGLAAQAPPGPNDFQRTIESLEETNRAILRELQEIRKLLQQQPLAAPAGEALPTTPLSITGEPVRGSASATVALIEFSDFQCPFCARFQKDTYVQINRDFVDTGKVKYVWRDLPLDMHPQARKAAEAAHCAGEQGKFWEMHDRLFLNQQALAPADLAAHAGALQLDAGRFQSCLDGGRFAGGINADIAEAGRLGITGTPSFLIGRIEPDGSVRVNQKIVGAKNYAEFKAALEAALASDRGGPGRGGS